MTATVLAVCTGNICRSPIVERLLAAALAHRLGPAAGIRVASAGTHALDGRPMEPAAAAELAARGIAHDGFAARTLSERLVEDADLVLAATRAHRAAVVELVPRAAARTFTVRELGRLAAGLALPAGPAPDRLRALAEAAGARRGLVPPAHPADDDLADPYLGPADGFQAVAGLAEAAVETIAATLAGPASAALPGGDAVES